MTKFYVIQRFTQAEPQHQFKIFEFEALTEDEAWDLVEEEISENTSVEWVMTEEEKEHLDKVLHEQPEVTL
jgi:hypothetical protein